MSATVEFYPLVFNYAMGLTGNKADAEDLTQEVFERALKVGEPEHGQTRPWLLRITKNVFIDSRRKKREIPSDFVDLGDEPIIQAEYSQNLADALAALPPDIRAVVMLCDAEGMTHDQVASVLNIAKSTVRSRLHRGRRALRAALA